MPIGPCTKPHLGIPLNQEAFPVEHHVGMRYWNIVKNTEGDNVLGAPIGSNNWAPGLNKGECHQKHRYTSDWMNCSCGLYCFLYGPNVGATHYFHFPTATPNGGGESGVVGGIAYWIPRTQNPVAGQTIVSAKYAAVACLMYPANVSKSHKKTIDGLAEFYGVEIVEPTEMKDAVDEWVANRLVEHFDPPARPLRELRGEQPVYTVAGDWTYTPRQRQAPAYTLSGAVTVS